MSTKPDAMVQINKTKDFKRIFTNAFTVRVGDNDCAIYCMYSDDPKDMSKAESEAAIVLTPKSAKILGTVLLASVAQLEEHLGIEIPGQSERHNIASRAFREAFETFEETDSMSG